MRKLPVGIQSFEKLCTERYLYMDKAEYIYQLATGGNQYFLGRPRRFGKSLLISTMEAYFLGKRELFQGLAMEKLERDWTEYPVFHVDLTGVKFKDTESLEICLNKNLSPLENVWGKDPEETEASLRFASLIRRACEKSGQKVVVLVDEYDKPLVDTMSNPALIEDYRSTLKAIYGVLKGSDQYLRFVFLKWVAKFSKVSVGTL